MSKNQNIVPGIITGLLSGGIGYLANKRERERQAGEFMRRKMIEDEFDQRRSERDFNLYRMKQQEEDSRINEAYDALSEKSEAKFIPEVQTEYNTENFFQGGGSSPVLSLLGMGKTVNQMPREMPAQEYYRNLSDLQRLKDLSGGRAKVDELYSQMAKSRGIEAAQDPIVYDLQMNRQTGQSVWTAKNRPGMAPIVQDSPALREKDIRIVGQGESSPRLTGIDMNTGKKIDYGPNPNYQPYRLSSFGAWEKRVNIKTGKVDLLKPKGSTSPFGYEREKSYYEGLNKERDRVIGDMETLKNWKANQVEEIPDGRGGTIKVEDFQSGLYQEKQVLAEKIKHHLGQHREIYDSAYRRFKENSSQGRRGADFQFRLDLWAGALDAYEKGQINDDQLFEIETMYYLDTDIFPREDKALMNMVREDAGK